MTVQPQRDTVRVRKLVAIVALGAGLLAVCASPEFAKPAPTSSTPAVATAPADRAARASRSTPRNAAPVTVSVPADMAWSLNGTVETQAMADAFAAELEALRLAAEQAAAAQAAAEAAAAAAKAAAQAARAAQPSPSAPAPASGSVKEYASSLVGGGEQFACLDALFQHESGWNAAAKNPSSGAFGIPQALPGSKMASAGADWATNAETQVRWGVGYVNGRYGSACDALAAWNGKGWY